MEPNTYIAADFRYEQGPVPRDYEFRGNLIIQDGNVATLLTNGPGGSAPLDLWIASFLPIGEKRLFGPPKKVKGWTLEQLVEAHAVGLYCSKK